MEIQSELFAFCLYPIKDSCKLDSQKSTWVDVKSDYFCLMFAYFFLNSLVKFPKKTGKRGTIPYHRVKHSSSELANWDSISKQ